MSDGLKQTIDDRLVDDLGECVLFVTDDSLRTCLMLAEIYGITVLSRDRWSIALKRPSTRRDLDDLAKRNACRGVLDDRNVADDLAVIGGMTVEEFFDILEALP